MTADELINSYVAEVAQLLPRKQRRDVAMELRALLHDELDAQAGSSNREDAALALVNGFGRPAEVAARYGSPVTLIDPADTRRFIILTVGGVVVMVAGMFLQAFTQPDPAGRTPWVVLRQWAPEAWFQMFTWPGLLVVGFAVAAWTRRRWPKTAVWKPTKAKTGRINRFGWGAAFVFYLLGTFMLVNPAWFIEQILGERATPATYAAFAYDEDFLRLRGPVLLVAVCLALAHLAILLVQGRWQAMTRKASLVLGVVMCGILTWAIAAGPIFQAVPTDEAMRGAIALVILFVLIDLGLRYRKYQAQR